MRRVIIGLAAGLVTGLVAGAVMLGAASAAPAGASAGPTPGDLLTYVPYKLVHAVRPPSHVDRWLRQLDSYGIDQPFLQTPRFSQTGVLTVPRRDRIMLARWSDRSEAYNAEHGTELEVTAVFNGEVETRTGIDLDDPDVRTTMVAGIESILATGVAGVHLDLEPYPVTPGFVSLLAELNAMFDRVGFAGRLSVVAPGFATKWAPAHLRAISEQVTQINPLLYDSEHRKIAVYQKWISDSLAYYSAHADPATRIVPVLPSYSANPWHAPRVENIGTATAALARALGAGSRVNGAGIWWWWGFFYDEQGAYDGSADRSAWRERTKHLPFTP